MDNLHKSPDIPSIMPSIVNNRKSSTSYQKNRKSENVRKASTSITNSVSTKPTVIGSQESNSGVNSLNLSKRLDEQEIDGNQLIPYPFLKYYKKEWFPKHIGYEVSKVCKLLIQDLKTDLKDVLQCIIKAHR